VDHAFFILLSYAVSFGAAGALAAWVIRSGRDLARQLPDEDKPWG
jgi:heme exporter protein CcmD